MIDFSAEIHYKTSRSGGSGGQNVNKVETMVEARWFPEGSVFFTPEEKQRIVEKLGRQLNRSGLLQVQCSETRFQLENKGIARQKLLELVHKALLVPKQRKATKVPARVVQNRLENKRKAGEKKAQRREQF